MVWDRYVRGCINIFWHWGGQKNQQVRYCLKSTTRDCCQTRWICRVPEYVDTSSYCFRFLFNSTMTRTTQRKEGSTNINFDKPAFRQCSILSCANLRMCALLQFPDLLAYNVSKSAVDQMTKCVALGEWICSWIFVRKVKAKTTKLMLYSCWNDLVWAAFRTGKEGCPGKFCEVSTKHVLRRSGIVWCASLHIDQCSSLSHTGLVALVSSTVSQKALSQLSVFLLAPTAKASARALYSQKYIWNPQTNPTKGFGRLHWCGHTEKFVLRPKIEKQMNRKPQRPFWCGENWCLFECFLLSFLMRFCDQKEDRSFKLKMCFLPQRQAQPEPLVPGELRVCWKLCFTFSPGVIETELQRRAGLNETAYQKVSKFIRWFEPWSIHYV